MQASVSVTSSLLMLVSIVELLALMKLPLSSQSWPCVPGCSSLSNTKSIIITNVETCLSANLSVKGSSVSLTVEESSRRSLIVNWSISLKGKVGHNVLHMRRTIQTSRDCALRWDFAASSTIWV